MPIQTQDLPGLVRLMNTLANHGATIAMSANKGRSIRSARVSHQISTFQPFLIIPRMIEAVRFLSKVKDGSAKKNLLIRALTQIDISASTRRGECARMRLPKARGV